MRGLQNMPGLLEKPYSDQCDDLSNRLRARTSAQQKDLLSQTQLSSETHNQLEGQVHQKAIVLKNNSMYSSKLMTRCFAFGKDRLKKTDLTIPWYDCILNLLIKFAFTSTLAVINNAKQP